MTERSGPWDGTSIGDATEAAYDAPTEFARFMEGVHGGTTNRGGIVVNKLNELVVTAPGSISPVSINTGWAYVYGTWYESDASVSVAIPTPSVSTRIDRIVLRKNWAAQTVRVTRIAGTEGAGAPALVQIVGTTWDVPLAQVSITTGGSITVTDMREIIPRVGFSDSEGDPANVVSAAGNDGASVYPARRDHSHHLGLLEGVLATSPGQTIGDGATSSLQWNNEIFDDNSMHDVSVNNDRLIAVKGGKYLVGISLNLSVATPGAGTITIAAVGISGLSITLIMSADREFVYAMVPARIAAGGIVTFTLNNNSGVAVGIVNTVSNAFMQYIGE